MKRRIVTPEEFRTVFVKATNNKEEDLIAKWEDPKEFTELMLNPKDGVLNSVAADLKLTYWSEYYGLDAVFYEGTVSNMKFEEYARYFNIALEHENDIRRSYVEMNKLCLFNAALKVLITYPSKTKTAKEMLNNYSTIVNEADIDDFQKHMVIFGFKDSNKIIWESYVYKDGEFGFLR